MAKKFKINGKNNQLEILKIKIINLNQLNKYLNHKIIIKILSLPNVESGKWHIITLLHD